MCASGGGAWAYRGKVRKTKAIKLLILIIFIASLLFAISGCEFGMWTGRRFLIDFPDEIGRRLQSLRAAALHDVLHGHEKLVVRIDGSYGSAGRRIPTAEQQSNEYCNRSGARPTEP